jgi:hypothetical protein
MGQRARGARPRLRTLPDTDSEELAALIQRLRAELLDLDVDRVEPLPAGEVSEGAKGVELLTLDGPVVQFVLQPEVLTSKWTACGLSSSSTRRGA